MKLVTLLLFIYFSSHRPFDTEREYKRLQKKKKKKKEKFMG